MITKSPMIKSTTIGTFNEWMDIPKEVIESIYQLMRKWKTRVEIWNEGENVTSRWIEIQCGLLQRDCYSPVRFCVSDIPVCQLLQQRKGYSMGKPENINLSRTHSLFRGSSEQ